MSKFDGSPDPLSYGQSLVEIASRVSWPSEAHATEAIRAIQAEHDILPPDPDVVALTDPRDADLAAKDAELDKLRADLAARQKKDAEAAKDAEIAALKAQLTPKDKATK